MSDLMYAPEYSVLGRDDLVKAACGLRNEVGRAPEGDRNGSRFVSAQSRGPRPRGAPRQSVVPSPRPRSWSRSARSPAPWRKASGSRGSRAWPR
jgi:hypothetical protein